MEQRNQQAIRWLEVLCLVRHIQLSNDFNAWRSWSRHENRNKILNITDPAPTVAFKPASNLSSRICQKLRSFAPEMVSSFKYGPLDFAKNEIRLVTIAAGSPSDELKGNLFHTLLDTYSSASPDDRPGYDALSYCWGDATGIRDVDGNINIKGQLFQLTPNLEAAIRSLRSPINDSVIWIDAICINQYNNEERNEQVKKMRHIYHTAETVRIWLGESYSDSSSAFELLRELATLAVKKTSEAIIHQDTVFITQRLKHFDALCSLFERSYWERVWIVQEIVWKFSRHSFP
jgi:hypothetical protein